MSKTSIIVGVLVVILIAAGGWYFVIRDTKGPVVSTAAYMCDAGKTINATFYKNSVSLSLSDGRSLNVPEVVAVSGTRYSNADQSFVFSTDNNIASITEGSAGIQTFSNCVAPNAEGQLLETYASSTLGYTVQYPSTYTLNDSFVYPFSAAKPIHGVSFTVPASMATGTNLAPDSYVSIEELPRAKICTGDIFLIANVQASNITESNGMEYSVASSTSGAAGSTYSETVYAIPGSNPCTAVRYFVHTSDIANYPAGTVQPYDATTLMSDFDTIRASLTLTR